MKRLRSALSVSVLLVGLIFAASSHGEPPPEGLIVAASTGNAGYGTRPFAISVQGKPVKGLYPGAVRDFHLNLQNPYPFDLRIERLRGEVVSSSRSRCRPGAGTIATRPYVGKLPLTVPARSRKAVGRIPVSMASNAPAACQDLTFTVQLTGTATKASR
jgi:hypothetical protein